MGASMGKIQGCVLQIRRIVVGAKGFLEDSIDLPPQIYLISTKTHTCKNWPKCNDFICNYMQLLVICNYLWTFLHIFLVLVIFVVTL